MIKLQKTYCPQCDIDVDYDIEEIKITSTVRGVTFEHPYLRSICKKCCESVSPHELSKKNDILFYDAYKRKVGLLTSEEIIAIRKKYHLSQVQLAKLIGCGEKNIARYENGAIQDRIFDNMLRLIDNEIVFNIAMKRNKSISKFIAKYNV